MHANVRHYIAYIYTININCMNLYAKEIYHALYVYTHLLRLYYQLKISGGNKFQGSTESRKFCLSAKSRECMEIRLEIREILDLGSIV